MDWSIKNLGLIGAGGAAGYFIGGRRILWGAVGAAAMLFLLWKMSSKAAADLTGTGTYVAPKSSGTNAPVQWSGAPSVSRVSQLTARGAGASGVQLGAVATGSRSGGNASPLVLDTMALVDGSRNRGNR